MFWTIWDPFGPVWTLLNNFKQKLVFAQKHLRQTQLYPYEATNWFLSEKVQKCPDGPKRVPNCQKHLGLPLRTPWTPLDHSGMLTSMLCLSIFVCFIGALFGGTLYIYVPHYHFCGATSISDGIFSLDLTLYLRFFVWWTKKICFVQPRIRFDIFGCQVFCQHSSNSSLIIFLKPKVKFFSTHLKLTSTVCIFIHNNAE